MNVKRVLLGLTALLIGGGVMAGYELTPKVHAGMPGEAPELGRAGQYPIGTAVAPMTLPGRAEVTALSAISGHATPESRTLSIRYWYPAAAGVPAAASQAAPVRYDHVMHFPGHPPFAVASTGSAVPAAPPAAGKFPLVVMSHGYGGWNTQFSNLAEHIASRGYVVAAIDHGDMAADSVASFILSFANVMVDRTLDQRQVLAQLAADAKARKTPWLAAADLNAIGLIGYSMGSYGALATAGAAYRLDAGPLAKLPAAAQESLRRAAAQPVPVKSLIVFAPWGGQPDSRAWNAAGMAGIKVPTLMVAGSQDDVVDYKNGVNWLFQNMTGAERYLLVYREARHNIVGNTFELSGKDPFMAAEFLKEPVWRSDRLNAINQHFVTAFLDLTLKGDRAKRAYLDVPTADADAGEWPTSLGEQLNGTTAGPEQGKYWRGFQRRWATGLELHKAGANK